MGTDKEDTDPSSPSALRPISHPTGATSAAHALKEPPSGQPTTDPGLGPTSAPPPASARRPMAVTVPAPSVRPLAGPSAITPPEFRPIATAAATPTTNKDSVELLLEGMAGPRPDRRKTTPQSDGEASASYHAEHGVGRARTSEPAGPKVLVDRPLVASLASLASLASPAVLAGERDPSPAAAGPPGGSQAALSTFVPARVLRRRMAMAIVAGALFVFLSFMALRVSGRRDVPAPTAPAEPPSIPVETAASPIETATLPIAPPSPALATAQASAAAMEPLAPSAEPLAPSAPTATLAAVHADAPHPAPPAHATGGGATTRRHRTAGDTPAPPAGDLGEFKSKF